MSHIDTATPAAWTAFWKSDPRGFNTIMNHATTFFAEQLDQKLPVRNTDRLLDLGCGPGFLVNQLKSKAAAVHGADISPAYIEACRRQHPEATFTCVKPYDNETYGNIIREHTINRVIMLSVMQYYTDKDAVKELIQTLAKAAQHQPLTFLIADLIPPDHAFLDDFKSLLGHALKKGYIFSLARFMTYAVFSDYRKYNKAGILQLEPAFFEGLGKELGVRVAIIKGLTPHSGRYNVLFDFNSPS